MRQLLSQVLLSAVALGAANAAHAGAVYLDRSAFNAAIAPQTTIDFQAQDTSSGGFTPYGSGLTVSGVTFKDPATGYLYVADSSAVSPSYDWGSGASLLFGPASEGGDLVITLPSNTFSFGVDFMAEADGHADETAGEMFTFMVNGVSYSESSLKRPGRAFFGLSSDTAITSIIISMPATSLPFRVLPIIDNFSFSSATGNTVPEPGELGLVGVALLGLAWARRRA